MEAKTIKIKRVSIFSFKNISNLVFDIFDDEPNVHIEGKNGLGKSNILNAIYWCLTGYDLSGCSDNERFITYGHEEDGVVDVEVITNVGKIERLTKRDAKGTLVQTIRIDDLPYDSLKEAEIEIDKRFGILPFTFSNHINKDFNLRRFLMNPSYHFGLAPKTIRDVLAKQVSTQINKPIEFNPLFVKLLNDNDIELGEPSSYYETIERLVAKYENDKKELKKSKEEDLIVLNFLKENSHDIAPNLIDNVSYKLSEITDTLNITEEKLMVLENAKQTLNAELEKAQTGLLRVQFQTTTSKGTKKSAYEVKSTGIELKQCSTSESIVDSFNLVENWRKSVGCDVSLPIFIDRAESMNLEKVQELEQAHQVLTTNVTTSRKIKINKAEVK